MCVCVVCRFGCLRVFLYNFSPVQSILTAFSFHKPLSNLFCVLSIVSNFFGCFQVLCIHTSMDIILIFFQILTCHLLMHENMKLKNQQRNTIHTDTTQLPKLSHTALIEQRNLCGMTAAAVNSFTTQHFLSMYLNLRYKWFITMNVAISKKMIEDWKFYQNIYYSLACTLASCNSVYTDTLYMFKFLELFAPKF